MAEVDDSMALLDEDLAKGGRLHGRHHRSITDRQNRPTISTTEIVGLRHATLQFPY